MQLFHFLLHQFNNGLIKYYNFITSGLQLRQPSYVRIFFIYFFFFYVSSSIFVCQSCLVLPRSPCCDSIRSLVCDIYSVQECIRQPLRALPVLSVPTLTFFQAGCKFKARLYYMRYLES